MPRFYRAQLVINHSCTHFDKILESTSRSYAGHRHLRNLSLILTLAVIFDRGTCHTASKNQYDYSAEIHTDGACLSYIWGAPETPHQHDNYTGMQ